MNNRRDSLLIASARKYCKAVVQGKTLKYNQLLVSDGYINMTIDNSSGQSTIYGSKSFIINRSLVIGHKYLIYYSGSKNISGNGICALYINTANMQSEVFDFRNQSSSLITITSIETQSATPALYTKVGAQTSLTLNGNVGFIDLTAIFGENYEPSSVADFYQTDLGKLIAKGKYFETTSENKFLNAQSPLRFIGRNIWNEQWEKCYYIEDGRGEKKYDDSAFGCKDLIKVFPNKQYYFNTKNTQQNTIIFYDKNKNFVNVIYNFGSHSFTTPNNCYYISFYFYGYAYQAPYNHDICINEFDSNFNGKYEPYCGVTTKDKVVEYNQQVENGDFNSTSDWYSSNVTFSVSNNIATMLATAQNGSLYHIFNFQANHKYYFVTKLKTTSATTDIKVVLRGDIFKSSVATTDTQVIEGIYNCPSTSASSIQIRDARASGWDNIYVYNLQYIDLTLLYGAGSEPNTLEDFYGTDLGGLIQKGTYLPTTTTNKFFDIDNGLVFENEDLKVTYNQQVKNGNFENTNSWSLSQALRLNVNDNVGKVEFNTVSDTSRIEQSVSMVSSHKYVIMFKSKTNVASTTCKLLIGTQTIANNFDVQGAGADFQDFSYFFTYSGSTASAIMSYYLNLNRALGYGVAWSDYVAIKDFMLIDLTEIFGSGNEPTTLAELQATDLGGLITSDGYLPYSNTNANYYVGSFSMQDGNTWQTWNGKLTKTMELVDLEDLTFSGDYEYETNLANAKAPSSNSDYPNALSENYNLVSRYNFVEGYVEETFCINTSKNLYILSAQAPSGKLLYETETYVIENVKTLMINRNCIKCYDINDIELDFTKD